MTKALAGIRPLVASALRMQIKSLPCDPQLLGKKNTQHVTPELLCRTVYL